MEGGQREYKPLVSVPLQDILASPTRVGPASLASVNQGGSEPSHDASNELQGEDVSSNNYTPVAHGDDAVAAATSTSSNAQHADPAVFTEQLQRLRARLQSVVQGVREVAQSLDEPHSLIANVRDQLQSRADSTRRSSISSGAASSISAPYRPGGGNATSAASDGAASAPIAAATAPSGSDDGIVVGGGPDLEANLSVKARVAAVEAVSRPSGSGGGGAFDAAVTLRSGSLDRRSMTLERRSAGLPLGAAAAAAAAAPPTTAPSAVPLAAEGAERERRERARDAEVAAANEDVPLGKRRRSGMGVDAGAPNTVAQGGGTAAPATAATTAAASHSAPGAREGEPAQLSRSSTSPEDEGRPGCGPLTAAAPALDSSARSGGGGGSSGGGSDFRGSLLRRSIGGIGSGRPLLAPRAPSSNGMTQIEADDFAAATRAVLNGEPAPAAAANGGIDLARASSSGGSGMSSMYAAAAAVAAADVAAADAAAVLGSGDASLAAATANAAAAIAYLEAHPETLRELWTLRARVRVQEGELASMVKQLSNKNAQLDAAQTTVQQKERELSAITQRLTGVLSRLQSFQAMHHQQQQELATLQQQREQQQQQQQQERQQRDEKQRDEQQRDEQQREEGKTRGSAGGASGPRTPETPRSTSAVVAHAIVVPAEVVDVAPRSLSTVDELTVASEGHGADADASATRTDLAAAPPVSAGGTPRPILSPATRATSLDVSLPPPPSVWAHDSPSSAVSPVSEGSEEAVEQGQSQAQAQAQGQGEIEEQGQAQEAGEQDEEQGQGQRQHEPQEAQDGSEQQQAVVQAREAVEAHRSEQESPSAGAEAEGPGEQAVPVLLSGSAAAPAATTVPAAEQPGRGSHARAATPPALGALRSPNGATHAHAALLASIAPPEPPSAAAAAAAAFRGAAAVGSVSGRRGAVPGGGETQQRHQQRRGPWGLLAQLGPYLACVALLLRDAGVRERLGLLRRGAVEGTIRQQPAPAAAAATRPRAVPVASPAVTAKKVRATQPAARKPAAKAAVASGGEGEAAESAASRECKAKWCKIIRPPPASAIYY